MTDAISMFRIKTYLKEIQVYLIPKGGRNVRLGSVHLKDSSHRLCAGININKRTESSISGTCR